MPVPLSRGRPPLNSTPIPNNPDAFPSSPVGEATPGSQPHTVWLACSRPDCAPQSRLVRSRPKARCQTQHATSDFRRIRTEAPRLDAAHPKSPPWKPGGRDARSSWISSPSDHWGHGLLVCLPAHRDTASASKQVGNLPNPRRKLPEPQTKAPGVWTPGTTGSNSAPLSGIARFNRNIWQGTPPTITVTPQEKAEPIRSPPLQ